MLASVWAAASTTTTTQRTDVTEEVVSTAIRMILWVLLLGGVAPRVLFRHRTRDGPTQVARMTVLGTLSATVLWLCGQLNMGTFGVSLAAYWVGSELRAGGALRSVVQLVWARFADSFYDPDAVLLDVAGTKTAKAKPKDDVPEALEKLSFTARVQSRLHVASSSAHRSVAIVRAQQEKWSGTVATAGARSRRWLRRGRGIMAAHVVALCVAIAAVIIRAQRQFPVTEAETERLMQVAGWSTSSATWLPDLLFSKLASALTFGALPVGAIALGAPLIFMASWSGAALFRRLAPGAPPILGALSCATVPAFAIAHGVTASLGLVVVSLAPWLYLCVGDVARRRGRPVWVIAAFSVLHPLAAPLALVMFIVSVVAERSERTPKSPVRFFHMVFAGAAILAAFLSAGGWTGWTGWLTHLEAPAAPPPRWLVVISCVSGAWLILAGLRSRAFTVTLPGRSLGLSIMAVVLLAGGFDGVPKLGFPPYTLMVFAGLAVAVSAADLHHLAKQTKFRKLASVVVPALVVAMAAGMGGITSGVPDVVGLQSGVIELSSRLRQDHLPWNFSIVGSTHVLPAFVDSAWVVGSDAVREVFPAETYHFDPERPDQIIGTRSTYLVVDLAPSPANDSLRTWIAELQACDAYPQPIRVPELSTNVIEVFVLERDPEWERAVLELR